MGKPLVTHNDSELTFLFTLSTSNLFLLLYCVQVAYLCIEIQCIHLTAGTNPGHGKHGCAE